MSSRRKDVFLPALLLALFQFANSAKAEPSSGETYVDKYGCQHCHMIQGKGSLVAPPLDGIQKHRNEDYIIERLTKNKTSGGKKTYPDPQEMMSHVRVPTSEAKQIAKYLLTLPDIKYEVVGHGKSYDEAPPGSHFVPLTPTASSDRGRKLFTLKGCTACHSFDESGTKLGPDLAGVGSRHSRKFITQRITEGALLLPKPGQKSGVYAMPPAKLTNAEIGDITNWLLTLHTPIRK